MITVTRAAILEELGKPLVIREITLPVLLPGQVLVKVFFSGVCRSQLMEVRGGRGADVWLPHLLGHEGSGQVLAIGQGVSKVAVNDEVILGWIRGDGMDAPGAQYHCAGQTIHSGRVTTFSQYTIVSESRIVKKPKGLPRDVAVLFGCALPTGAGMVLNELKPSKGQSVVVLGMGGIGLSALMALKSTECKQVIAVDISDNKLALAKDFGATHTINSKNENTLAVVQQLTLGGADLCIESAGTVASIELGYSLVRAGGGQLLFASHPPAGETIRLAPHDLISGKRIAGSWGGASAPDKDIPHMCEIFSHGKAPLERLLSKRYTLDEINQALDDLEAGTVFRPLIVMDHALEEG